MITYSKNLDPKYPDDAEESRIELQKVEGSVAREAK